MELKTLTRDSKPEAIDERRGLGKNTKRRTLLGHDKEQFSIEKPTMGSG